MLDKFCIQQQDDEYLMQKEQLHAHEDGYGPSSFEDEKSDKLNRMSPSLRHILTFSRLPTSKPDLHLAKIGKGFRIDDSSVTAAVN